MHSSDTHGAIRVVGIGSPHGDDQAGWRCAGILCHHFAGRVEIIELADPINLLDYLDDCRRLYIIDACASDAPAGSIRQFRWPDDRLGQARKASTHALGVEDALRLADNLGKLPPEVIVFVLETEKPLGYPLAGGLTLSPLIASALPELAERIINDIQTHMTNDGGG